MRIKVNDNLRNLINYIDSLGDVDGVDRTWRSYVQFAIDYDCYKELTLNYYLLKDIYDEKMKLIKEKAQSEENQAGYITNNSIY